jgi:hypothetical protein
VTKQDAFLQIMNSIEQLNRTYTVTIIIGVIMVATPFVFAVVVEYVKRAYSPFQGFTVSQEVDSLRFLLLIISAILFLLMGIIRNRALSRRALPYDASPSQNSSPSLIRRLSAVAIISFALSESIAVSGLSLFLVAGNSSDYYIFMVLSLVSFIAYFPRYSHWDKCLRTSEESFSGTDNVIP